MNTPTTFAFHFTDEFIQRFNESLDRSGGSRVCWNWQKYKIPAGYGLVGVGGRKGKLAIINRAAILDIFILATRKRTLKKLEIEDY